MTIEVRNLNWLGILREVVACRVCMEAAPVWTASGHAVQNAMFCPDCAEKVAKAILECSERK
jgi:hypothetical protein